MLYSYLHQINHNRYLKMNSRTPYLMSKLNQIFLYVRFNLQMNTKFLILCSFFLFKTTFFKSGSYILINKKTKHILGLKYVFTKQLLLNFLNLFILNSLTQPEILNNINRSAFDSVANFMFTIINSNCYFFERILSNRFYKKTLTNCNFHIVIQFRNNIDLFDHMIFLNFFKFYFNN